MKMKIKKEVKYVLEKMLDCGDELDEILEGTIFNDEIRTLVNEIEKAFKIKH